jgi:hypothetical protein
MKIFDYLLHIIHINNNIKEIKSFILLQVDKSSKSDWKKMFIDFCLLCLHKGEVIHM